MHALSKIFSKKIYIPFDFYNDKGGPYTFMKNLKGYLVDIKYPFTNRIFFAKGIFFPIQYDITVLKKFKKKNTAIIQRLDGISYPSKNGDKYSKQNKEIEEIYNNYASFVVFQSEYSKKQCFKIIGEKEADNYEIIINGVNKKMFYPGNNRDLIPKKFIFVTTGNFRHMEMLEPVIKALDGLIDKISFEFWIIGQITNVNLLTYVKRKYIKYLGWKNMGEVALLLRQSDVFLYSFFNPPCPNSVLEAVSSGLPVVGFDSGSMSELLSFSKDLLAYVSDDVIQEYKDFHFEKLKEKIVLVVENYIKFKKIAKENSNRYPMDECGRRYIAVFDSVKSFSDANLIN